MNELEKYTTEELKAELDRRHRIEMEKRAGRARFRYFTGVVTKVDGDYAKMVGKKIRQFPVPLDRWSYWIRPDSDVDSEGYDVRHYNGCELCAGFTKLTAPREGDRVRLRCWNYVDPSDNENGWGRCWRICEVLERNFKK